jgi:hypothetical protein
MRAVVGAEEGPDRAAELIEFFQQKHLRWRQTTVDRAQERDERRERRGDSGGYRSTVLKIASDIELIFQVSERLWLETNAVEVLRLSEPVCGQREEIDDQQEADAISTLRWPWRWHHESLSDETRWEMRVHSALCEWRGAKRGPSVKATDTRPNAGKERRAEGEEQERVQRDTELGVVLVWVPLSLPGKEGSVQHSFKRKENQPPGVVITGEGEGGASQGRPGWAMGWGM